MEEKRIGYSWDEFAENAVALEVAQLERACEYAGIAENDYRDCSVIICDGYYNLIKGAVTWDDLAIGVRCYPFDSERIYPMQELRVKICYRV